MLVCPANTYETRQGLRMRFALLLYLDPEAAARTTPEEAEAELAVYGRSRKHSRCRESFWEEKHYYPHGQRRWYGPGRPTDHSASPTTDLELSGFYLVDCEEDQVIDIAARMPVATHGAVEVRPLMELPDGLSNERHHSI